MTVLLVREMTEEAVHYVRWCHIIIHVIVTSCPHYQEHWLEHHGIDKLKFWAKNHHQTSVESDHDLWQVLDKYLETIRNTVCRLGMCWGDFNWFADPNLSHFCLHVVVTASALVIIVIMCDGENKSWYLIVFLSFQTMEGGTLLWTKFGARESSLKS